MTEDHPEAQDLPRPETEDGAPRRVGVEVELGGLDERAVTHILANGLGGTERQTGDYEWTVEGSDLGTVEILLDTKLRDHASSKIAQMGLDLGRAVIPVEYVTEPVLPRELARIEAVNEALVAAGALGTQDGVALGFGVHLNAALPAMSVPAILPTLRAFCLVEECLRDSMDIDPARRILPFVDPMPAALTDEICAPEADDWDMDALTDAYLEHAASRNHALDLLPILKQHAPDRVVAAVPQMDHKSARPAWHYRLPDCRIDDPAWSVTLEWNRWCAIERIGADADLLDRLCTAWRDHRSGVLHLPGGWRDRAAEILNDAGMHP
ncbi:Putative amidoligase enzyme [Palleronia salina]|uniref:Putative amidoligase enzyme n=1 Tax=Palleronia salina TaxID=313368 RepID=A0A1M6CLS1_9RHOB|nr:amidoligase family protein [Palleronia salina]SHI61873.1 Putative amidoligase enzyme [Palleronia salina]